MRFNDPNVPSRAAWVWLLAIAAAQLTAQMLTAGNYGIFRDEFYYLACANHPAWGYVDHPPFSIAALAVWKGVFGDSVHSIRLLAAMVGSATVVLTGLIASRLGGGRFAQVLAALVATLAPANLTIAGFYSMNVFDIALWAAAFLVLTHIINGGKQRLWLVLGIVLGAGLLNKISVLVLGAGIAGGLVLTGERRHLRSRHLWIGAAIALGMFLPHIVWQMTHGWPTAEFISNAKRYKIAAFTPVEFFIEQITMMHPLFFPLWFAGLGVLMVSRRMAKYRMLGWIFVIAFIVLVLQRSKPYYLVTAYAPLIAAGAVGLEQVTRVRMRWLRAAVAALVLVSGVTVAPMAIPVLPVDTFIRYQAALGLTPSSGENKEMGELPQLYADRFGWQEMTDAVVSVYQSLSDEEKRHCIIVTANYGQAGALEYYGRGRGLPRIASIHNNYFLWGIGEKEPALLITVGFSPAGLAEDFEDVTTATTLDTKYAMPYERHAQILIARGFKSPPTTVWAQSRNFS